MNKKDLSIVVCLFLLMFGWQFFYNSYLKPPAPPVTETAGTGGTNEVSTAVGTGTPAPVAGANPSAPPVMIPGAAASNAVVNVVEDVPEELLELSNKYVTLTFSSKGGSVVKGVFSDYHYTSRGETNVVLDFTEEASLVYDGLEGFGANQHFQGTLDEANRTVKFQRTAANGMQLVRTYTLQTNNYVVLLQDEFFNNSAAPAQFGEHKIRLGHVKELPGTTAMMPPGGIDVFNQNEVKHYSFKLPKWVKKAPNKRLVKEIDTPTEWVAVKNKYFGHLICALEGNMGQPTGFEMFATQSEESKYPDDVAAALKLPPGGVSARSNICPRLHLLYRTQKSIHA